MSFSKENLNPPQLEAVNTTQGPLLVLAGAGTGKTKVLTSRIIHIVASNLAFPSQILAVTFTNKAAAEMKRRIALIVGDEVNNLWISTFHSIAARILRRHPEIVGLHSDFVIIDDDDQTRLLKQILADFNIDAKQYTPKAYLHKISSFKDRGIFVNKVAEKSADYMNLPRLAAVYETYQNRLKAMNVVDFGDLLLYNLEIFNKAPEILEYYQNKFRYILVDEYQDTNNVQHQWLLLLAKKHYNICCVGDDDQSIYSWRGANIANILTFEKNFKDSEIAPKIIRLEQNYRSTAHILNTAHSVINNNSERHGKKLWTEKKDAKKVKLLAFFDDRSEAQTITSLIKDKISEGKITLSQIAVLVRAGYQTRSFEEAFMQNSLPYKVIGGLKFYERMEIKDAIAYLRVIANHSDDLALLRIINTPKRGIGGSTIEKLSNSAKEQGVSLFTAIKNCDLKGKTKEALNQLISMFEEHKKNSDGENLSEIAKSVLQESGYIQSWKNENTLEAQGRLENIEEFIRSLDEFSSLSEFLEYVSLIEARDNNPAQEGVNIMTVHGAKGLEFELVFIPGLEDGIFPSGRSIEEKGGVEEERRLLYVAITRAKDELYLTYANNRYLFGQTQPAIPSRFLKELSEETVEFTAVNNYQNSWQNFGKNSGQNNLRNAFFDGEESNSNEEYNLFGSAKFQSKTEEKSESDSVIGKRIFHKKFGYGKIISVDGAKLEIAFEKTDKKTLIKDFIEFC